MRVCITGATGFVGQALTKRLLASGAQIRALARPSPRADSLMSQGVEVILGDLNDTSALDRAVEDAEIVYHAAALVQGPWTRTQFVETNVEGTKQLLLACARKSVKHVVYLSSIAVYGPIKGREQIDELTPWDESPEKRDSYSNSKILADQFVTLSDLPVTILRPGIIYGPGRPLPVALLGFELGNLNVVFGRRQNRFPLNYIENLIDAILLVSEPTGQRMRQYIVIDDDNLTLSQYHKFRSKSDRTRTVYLPGWPLQIGATVGAALIVALTRGYVVRDFCGRQIRRALQDRHYSTRRIREELGWAPKIPLQDAIERTLRGSLT
jgi:dihydroflavonol-4-reductase